MEEPDVGQQMRTALRSLAQPVGVMLGHDGLEVRGATVTSFFPVALDPATIAVSIGHERRVYTALEPGHACSLNVLASGQEHIADYFGSRALRESGVHSVRLGRSEDDVPIVPRSLFTFVGRAGDRVSVGDHALIVVHVEQVLIEEDAGDDPLVWQAGGYAYLER